MHIQILLLLPIFTLSVFAAPARNLTSFLATNGDLPYPSGYSTQTCPDNGNAWSDGQSPKSKARSFATPTRDMASSDHESPSVVFARSPDPNLSVSRRQAGACSGVARQNFNFNGIGQGYRTADILLQAGIQYVVSFSSNAAVTGVTIWQEPIGAALSHVVSHPNFARTVSGTVSFTLQAAANGWMVMRFGPNVHAQGEIGIFGLNTPDGANMEVDSGGL